MPRSSTRCPSPSVKLLADEGVDALTVARQRADGHNVTYVAELAPGIAAAAVLDLTNAEARVAPRVREEDAVHAGAGLGHRSQPHEGGV
jgi:hypothetical protein